MGMCVGFNDYWIMKICSREEIALLLRHMAPTEYICK